VKAIAPGKIILSGEHAVVYGNSALVVAVNGFSETVMKQRDDKRLSFNLIDFNNFVSYSIDDLRNKSQQLDLNYDLFVNKKISVKQIVNSPGDIFAYLCIKFFATFAIKVKCGIELTIKSEIPTGCGMGSSASTIMSLARGLAGFFSIDFDPEQLYFLGLETEKFIHGYSSGLDPYVSLYGGLNKFQQKRAKRLKTQDIPMYIVNTGPPVASTGESVEYVARNFGKSKIWNEFQTVTNEFEKAYLAQRLDSLINCVRENNKLLSHIGVVPPAIMDFITKIETVGGAAKISGAGSVRGQRAGILMIISAENPKKVCDEYGYEPVSVKGEPQGARVV